VSCSASCIARASVRWGRIESHTLDSLQRVSAILGRLSGEPDEPYAGKPIAYDEGEEVLARRTMQLLGPRPAHRTPRIMVTMPTDAAERYELVRDLIAAGMQVARINCAHDDADTWAAIGRHLRRAAGELNLPCVVLCDLPGPKLRTGAIEVGPGVVRWHAFKSAYGEVLAPARVWIGHARPPVGAQAVLPTEAAFVAQLQPDDEIHFRDHQGRNRWVVVDEVEPGGVWARGARGVFIVQGIALTARRSGEDLPVTGHVRALPPQPAEIELKVDDTLWLTRDDVLGRPAVTRADGAVAAAQIGCTLPEVLEAAAPGHRVYLDDGKIAAVVEEVLPGRLRLRITWTRSSNARLASEKGINLPDTRLEIASLTAADLGALDFVASHRELIDNVGLSFVRDAEDVRALYDALEARSLDVGVILKVETAAAFSNLPAIVLTGLRRHKVGVMIARGDLGVEVGFERMAELQEEIASLCAAAHLPVVWATQVLESLAKKGMPSRAEVSDVVLAARTQCVMLNKGPHLVAAVRFLADVLTRMETHQDKHFRLLRALRVAQAHAQRPC
jgi:pyruvate kinase